MLSQMHGGGWWSSYVVPADHTIMLKVHGGFPRISMAIVVRTSIGLPVIISGGIGDSGVSTKGDLTPVSVE